MAKKDNKTTIGFEETIWRAADKLRGNLNASEYEGVVLGLIFLKYISDRFDTLYQELSEDEYADQEDKDEYTAAGIFFVPKQARWDVISTAAHSPEIGKKIDEALKAIGDENPKLKSYLPGNYSRPELDKRRLGDVVDLFTNIKMHEAGESKDLLGRVYEYCLKKFASMEGKNAGEFYTPSCIVRLIVEILQPYEGRVYDPCCGSGGMFVQSVKFLENHQQAIDSISVYGQEANSSTWKMAHMNTAIRGLEADLGTSYADTFFDDQHPTLRADFIMANPPFNLSDWGADKLINDVRWKFGLPPKNNANFAWMQHMIHHLSPKGRIGLVLANGSLSSQTGGEGLIREKIIKADLVEGIIALPPQLFYNTQIPVSLWFLSRDKKQKGKVIFIDARNMGQMVTRSVRELTDANIDNWKKKNLESYDVQVLAETFEAFRNGTLEDKAGFCAVKNLGEIAAQDYNLTPGRYVGIAKIEENGEPFEEKMDRLTKELAKLFYDGRDLEDKINKRLNTIGYNCHFPTFQDDQIYLLSDILRECNALSDKVLRRICESAIQRINKDEKGFGLTIISDEHSKHLTFFDKLSLKVIGEACTYNEVHPGLEEYILSYLKDEYEKITAEEAFFIRYANYYEEYEEFTKVSSMFYKMLEEHYETEGMEPYHL
jgi:type I restriction enzyme M protein